MTATTDIGLTGVGKGALQSSSGGYNTAMGPSALANVTGNHNVAIGRNTMGGAGATNYCVAVGDYALDATSSGDSNVAIGYNALTASTTGAGNVAVGHEAGKAITTSGQLTAVGYRALYTQVAAGSDNTAIGYEAMYAADGADFCVAVGHRSMIALTDGQYNTAMGVGALHAITDSDYNTAIGSGSLRYLTGATGHNTAIGHNSLHNVTTGYSNVAIGVDTGDTITTGMDNTYLGRHADASGGGVNNEISVGSNITGAGTNTFMVKGSSGVYNSGNTTAWQTTSDERIKKNIVDNNTGLDILNQIQVRNFEYRTVDEIVDFDNPKAAVVEKEGLQLGVIAQEIAEVLPEVVKTQSTGVKTVDPDNLTWYMVNAIKQLSAENNALKARLDAAGL